MRLQLSRRLPAGYRVPKRRVAWAGPLAFLAALGATVFAGLRCGQNNPKKKDSGSNPATNATLPAGWLGDSDWAQSAMEVIDE